MQPYRPVLLIIFLLLFSSVAVALDVPPLRGRVNDYANVLQSSQAQALEAQLAQLERDTGHQVAVLTVPTLDGEDIEGFSIRVAENWKIGKKGYDNGAILVVAVKDRRLRLEVGYGLEGVLPDAIAKRVTADYIVPHFRQQDYAGGIVAGIAAVDKVIRKEPLPEAARKKTQSRGWNMNSPIMIAITFAILGLMGFASTERSPAQQHVGHPRPARRAHDLWRSQRLGRRWVWRRWRRWFQRRRWRLRRRRFFR